jgi:hypothetical protein
VTGTVVWIEPGSRNSAENAEVVEETTVRLEAEAAPHEMANYCLKDSEPQCYLFHLSYNPQAQAPEDRRPFVHLSTRGEWDAECISSSLMHIECTGISYRTWSWFSRNCYKQLECDRPTWVLFLVEGDPLRCFGCDHVRCSGVVTNRYGSVSLWSDSADVQMIDE